MFLFEALSTHGWRRTGTINVLIIFSCGLLLSVCLLVNIFLQPSRSVSQGRIIFDGDCDKANRLGLGLHLVINIFSTGLLASSNFFMQVLSAPSRREIDRAHRYLVAMEIGVPSMKNFMFLSPFKMAVWVGLFLSSIPVHLLFNSAIYETNYEGSDWNLTMATDAFVTGEASYFAPGASLANSGSPIPEAPEYRSIGGYGEFVPLTDYWDNSSPPNRSITTTAREAAGWTRLTLDECYSEYRFCQPKKKYRDVVVVIALEELGWTRAQVFNFNRTNTTLTPTWEEWDAHIPPDTVNSLWFSAQCSNIRYSNEFYEYPECSGYGHCAGALGDPDLIAWTTTSELTSSTWVIPFLSPQWKEEELDLAEANITAAYGFNESYNDLTVAYCLAEPAPVYKCKVGASNALLLVVVLCTLSKVALCILVIYKLPESSLVTLGDAIESFIAKPDPKTAGLGTFNNLDSHRLERQKRSSWQADGLLAGPRPRRWHFASRRFKTVITKEIWVRTYIVLSAGLVLLAVALGVLVSSYGLTTLTGSFGSSDNNLSVNIFVSPPSYIVMLLAANAPQIILSFCYFSFNAFFTRTQTESEWSSYSLSYKPLRVSVPKGEQSSTYRLQLPYRYSLPLLGISILLHWILSNAIFFYVVEGGYWISDQDLLFSPSDLGVSDDAFMALGVSGKALLTMLVVSAVLCFMPVMFSHRKVPGSIVSGGSNSLVLSAACHASVLARHVPSKELDALSPAGHTEIGRAASRRSQSGRSKKSFGLSYTGVEAPPSPHDPWSIQGELAAKPVMGSGFRESEEGRLLLPFESSEEQEEHELSLLREVTLGRVKWGAMSVDPDLLSSLNLDGIDGPVKHLGFGSEDDKVEAPQEGHFYI